MKIVYLGSGAFGIDSLNALLNSKHTIDLVVTQPAKAAGRGRKTKPTDVAIWANDNGIDVIETANAAEPDILNQIRDRNPDIIVVIAFGQRICSELIDLPPKGMINVHGSVLPSYRGAAPINWAMVNGDKQTGITVASVTDDWDAGKVLAIARTPIADDETADTLYRRLAAIAGPVLKETVDKIEAGTAQYTEQDHSKVTRAPKIKKTDGYIDFSLPAEKIRNMIRGFWPWPGASAIIQCSKTGKHKRVTIVSAQLAETQDSDLPAGTLDRNMNIVCGQGALKIDKVKPAGSAVMDFKAYINGHQTASGDRFVKIEQ